MGVALGSSGTTQGFLLDGWYNQVTSPTVSPGTPFYLSGTSGGFSNTPPASGFVRLVGWLVESGVIYFRPDNTYIEL